MSTRPRPSVPAFPASEAFMYGAGPSEPEERVLQALARKAPGHVDPKAWEMFSQMSEMLRYLLGTSSDFTLTLPFNGQLGVETSFQAFLTTGDTVVIPATGGFAARMKSIAERLGTTPVMVDQELGKAPDPSQVADILRQHPDAVLAFVDLDTSTGTQSPTDALFSVAADLQRRLIVDAVTSAPTAMLQLDRLGNGANGKIPIAVSSCGQKRFGGLAGTAPYSLNPLGVDYVKERSAMPFPSWTLDLNGAFQYWGGRTYTTTTAMQQMIGMHEAYRVLCEIGLEELTAMQTKASNAFDAAVAASGLKYYFPADRSLAIKAVAPPEGVEVKAITTGLYEAGIEVSGALGALAGKFFRVGLLSPKTLELSSLTMLFTALVDVLNKNGKTIAKDGVLGSLRSAYV